MSTTTVSYPYNLVDWVKRDARIEREDGTVAFEARDLDFPDTWSQTAVNIVANKYFRTINGVRETSVRQMIDRVVDTIADYGIAGGWFTQPYFDITPKTFREELKRLILEQRLSFNSPVWFNVGVIDKPQCSACFILDVEDTMESIIAWNSNEARIFKGGSGSGVNLSKLRGSNERLSGGGVSSGPVSFMRGADSIAGSIKSGGTTRRAAKMVILNVDHPDVEEFIESKAHEGRKVRALAKAGFNFKFDSPEWDGVQYQNANNSVRVTDEFMGRALTGKDWDLTNRKDGSVAKTLQADELLTRIAAAAWECGCPGLQFDDTIQRWNTLPEVGRINGSNPCSEYMHLDNTACNLASINLLKFYSVGYDAFDVEGFQDAVRISILAQDILVSLSSYPTPKIAENAEMYRELGLGYANLGALFLAVGAPYGSEKSMQITAAITSAMTAFAYDASRQLVCDKALGWAGDGIRKVIHQHADAWQSDWEHLDAVNASFKRLGSEAKDTWQKLSRGHFAYRNTQVTLLAPTGTIAFMMDCDTTGIEPLIAPMTMKKLVGGGSIMTTYDSFKIAMEKFPGDKALFKTAFGGVDSEPLGWLEHLNVMAAAQPYLSGAISKTVNLPGNATVDDVKAVYVKAWKLGLKAIAVYRDGSKEVQPMSSYDPSQRPETAAIVVAPPAPGIRRRLSPTRLGETHKFSVGGHEGYIHIGLYDDGQPGEIFLTMAKEGSSLSGFADAFSIAFSYALQYNAPLEDLVRKFKHTRFEPSGFTENPDIRIADSILDYVAKYLELRFLDRGLSLSDPYQDGSIDPEQPAPVVHTGPSQHTGNLCSECGGVMTFAGNCFRCQNCGGTSGCS